MTHGRRWPASPSAIAAFVPTISARYMWLWTTSARTSARWAARVAGRDRVVGLVDHGDVDPGALELAYARARRERHDRDVVARAVHPGHEVVDVLLRAAVRPGRHDLDDADALTAAGAARRRTGARQGSQARRSSSPFRSSDQQALDWLRPRAPHSYLYGSSPRRKSMRADPALQRAPHVALDHQHARRQLARVGVHAGVVVQDGVRGLERDAGGDPPAADGEERELQRVRPSRTARTADGRTPGSGAPPGVAGNRPSTPQRFWWRSMNASRSAIGSALSVEQDLARRPPPAGPCAGSRGAPSCPGWRGSRRWSRPRGASSTGQTSSRSRLTVQRLAHLASPEGRRERVGRRVAAPEPAEVHGVPGRGWSGSPSDAQYAASASAAASRSSGAHEERRVVRVVRGAEEDRLRVVGGPASAAGRPRGASSSRARRRRAPPRGGA